MVHFCIEVICQCFISENIKISLLGTPCTSIFVEYIYEKGVYLQIQTKFAVCAKAVKADRTT